MFYIQFYRLKVLILNLYSDIQKAGMRWQIHLVILGIKY